MQAASKETHFIFWLLLFLRADLRSYDSQPVLLKGPKKLYADKMHIAGRLQSQHPGLNRSVGRGHQTSSGWGRSRNRQRNNFICLQLTAAGQVCPSGADIQGFGEVEELLPHGIYTPKKHWHLEAQTL